MNEGRRAVYLTEGGSQGLRESDSAEHDGGDAGRRGEGG